MPLSLKSSSSFSLTRTHERAHTHTNTHTNTHIHSHTPGVEGGLEEKGDGKLECFAWLIFLSGDEAHEKVGAARTATFELPEQVTLLHDEAIKLDLKHL